MAEQDECRPTRDDLHDLYRIAIDEYRFNVKLSWDRTRFFVGLNTALVTAAAAVTRFWTGPELWLVPISFIGVVICLSGIRTIQNGHQYYRRSIYKKTLLEAELGLTSRLPAHDYSDATLSVSSTQSRASGCQEYLGEHRSMDRPRNPYLFKYVTRYIAPAAHWDWVWVRSLLC